MHLLFDLVSLKLELLSSSKDGQEMSIDAMGAYLLVTFVMVTNNDYSLFVLWFAICWLCIAKGDK